MCGFSGTFVVPSGGEYQSSWHAHGTVARALAAGKPLLVCPAVGDMGENAARVVWSGTGLSIPRRLLSRQAIRLGTRELLTDRRFKERAMEMAGWSEENDGAAAAADLVEEAAFKQLRGWDSNPQQLG